ncbi:uncharacterized protein [Periplaneta americana]|uniref:uncharacterized protein isoform X2 n=1 Tax=Periplaneta americana TaxID=6978 RepID=UPI0037E70A15
MDIVIIAKVLVSLVYIFFNYTEILKEAETKLKLTTSVNSFQPDNVGESYEFSSEDDSISCTRECTEQTLPRLCHYRFVLENYNVLSLACQNCRQNMSQCYNPQCIAADGYERGILTVNRMLPGPSIQVCYGDKIVVDVKNEMPSQSTTIHWHGLFQRGTPFYDGVPMITQCPIVGGNTFRYQFYANQPGTFYWHSHDGIQKSDGLQGSLVVRRPRDHEPNGQLYDYDLPAHVIVISDWSHRPAIDHFPGLMKPVTATYETFFLINGRGRFTDPVEGTTTTPHSVFRVHPGKRYRFRVVGAICIHCPALLSIDGHNLTIIDTDGNSVKPVEVQALHLHSGERHDFILSATNEVKSYWIRVKGGSTCAKMESSHQKAVLQYQGAAETEPREPGIEDEDVSSFGLIMNPQNATCGEGELGVCVSQLEAAEPIDEQILKPDPDVNSTIIINYLFPTVKELYQSNTFRRYSTPRMGANHPFHLHGFAFNVMAMGNLKDTEMNAENIVSLLKSNQLQQSSAPPLKDTIAIPSGGFVVLRIFANNSGFWSMHCHYLDHHMAGMSLTVQVGDPKDNPPIPAGFPKCGNFVPLD